MNAFEAIVKARIITANNACTSETVLDAIRRAMEAAVENHSPAGRVAVEITGIHVMCHNEKGAPHGD